MSLAVTPAIQLQRRLLATVALLTSIGFVAIFAASSLKGAQQFGDEFLFLRKQATAAGVGIVMIVMLQLIPFVWIQRATLPILGLTTVLLGLIFVPGMYSKINGAERWLNLPLVGGQPSELAKLALILFLAKSLARPSSDMNRFTHGVLPNLLVYGTITGLLLVQKDLGTPALLFLVMGAMLLVAGVSRRLVVGAIVAGVLGISAAIIAEPFRMARITAFLDPWSTMQSGGFQIIQSFLAFNNGGLFGAGLGASKQKLFFLPEAQSDFILAVIAEELGLFGVLLVLSLFAYLGYVGFRIAGLQRDPYRKFLAFGLTTVLTLQAALNMGVTMGLLPTKGMPLPFISSGTSSLLVYLALTAILARLAREIPESPTDGVVAHAERSG